MSVYDETVSDISRAITSILNQTYKNIELIVILDKPDNIDAFNYLKSINDKRIIFLPNKENIGLGFSLNNAINVASGDYIARMDADDVSHSDRLKHELNYLTKSDLDLVFCEVELVGNMVKNIGEKDWSTPTSRNTFLNMIHLYMQRC